jgi:hypothetical protein
MKTLAEVGTIRTVALLIGLYTCLTGVADEHERQMNVRQGPDAVFDRPVGELLPILAGSRETGENGRVGNELVFWGFELADGRQAFLFAVMAPYTNLSPSNPGASLSLAFAT